ncbi:MAG: elongation factor P [Microgenomates group bacterium]
MLINAGNLKKGDFISYQNEIWQIQKAEFYSPGKGSALMKLKVKNIISGKTIDITFKSNENVEVVDVMSVEMQFLYKDNESLYFMDEKTFNQYSLPIKRVGQVADFLKEGLKVYVYLHDDQALTIRPPMSVRLKVVKTEVAIKGDTVTGAKKPAKLETGVTIMVPLFIKEGETVIVNPETGEYMERA